MEKAIITQIRIVTIKMKYIVLEGIFANNMIPPFSISIALKEKNPKSNRGFNCYFANTLLIFSKAQSISVFSMINGGAKRITLSCVSLHNNPSSINASQ